MKNTKRKPKATPPHRYFLMPTSSDPDGTCSAIVVFQHGLDEGSGYFRSGDIGCPWWTLKEMEILKCVEIPAALIKRLPR